MVSSEVGADRKHYIVSILVLLGWEGEVNFSIEIIAFNQDKELIRTVFRLFWHDHCHRVFPVVLQAKYKISITSLFFIRLSKVCFGCSWHIRVLFLVFDEFSLFLVRVNLILVPYNFLVTSLLVTPFISWVDSCVYSLASSMLDPISLGYMFPKVLLIHIFPFSIGCNIRTIFFIPQWFLNIL